MKRLLRALILLLVRLLGLPGAYIATRHAHSQGKIKSPRILLVRPDHLGDMVLVTPILQALKTQAPNAEITMMVGPWSSEVVARHPAIDHLITCQFPGFQRAPQYPLTPYTLLLRTARQIRRGHYDLAINLRPDFWWGAALLYLACIPYRIGYAIQPNQPFLTNAILFPTEELAAISNLRLASIALQTLNHASLAEPFIPERYPLSFTPTANEREWVAQHLQAGDIDPESPIVVIHPGTGAAVKLWRPDGWSYVANMLSTSSCFSTPVHIVLTGSQQELPLLEEIARGITPPPLLLTGTTVGQLAALLTAARLVLGVDSGPLHLAVSQATPTIRLFGPTDARIFGPWGPSEHHIVIASTRRCPGCPIIPCGRLDFRPDELDAHPCVRLISEQKVEDTITNLLKSNLAHNPIQA